MHALRDLPKGAQRLLCLLRRSLGQSNWINPKKLRVDKVRFCAIVPECNVDNDDLVLKVVLTCDASQALAKKVLDVAFGNDCTKSHLINP